MSKRELDTMQRTLCTLSRRSSVGATGKLLRALAPHLKASQISECLAKLEQGSSLYLALPPLLVADSVQLIHLTPASPTRKTSAQISYFGAQKAEKAFSDVEFVNEALAFAEDCWPERLRNDNWEDCGVIYLDDATDTYDNGFSSAVPKTKMVLYFSCHHSWETILQDTSELLSKTISNGIAFITHQRILFEELRTGRKPTQIKQWFNCALCSGGLNNSECSHCHVSFEDCEFHTGWQTPLPTKLLEYAQLHGHRFVINPQLAQNLEEQNRQAQRAA